MYSSSFLLLQNEGFLMQGCLKSSLHSLRGGSTAEPGPFFVAFFNYSVGLERLLKVIVLLDHYVQNAGQFPGNSVLKTYCHDLEGLQATTAKLLSRYNVKTSVHCLADKLDSEFLKFFSGFAKRSRYFNLDTLTGGCASEDPLEEWGDLVMRVYESDIPVLKRMSNEDQVSGLVELTKEFTVHIPATGMDGRILSYEEFCQDHARVKTAMPHVAWRLVKALVPLKDLLLALREVAHQVGRTKSNNPDVPFMEEFLEFVCDDKTVVLEDSDWPYLVCD